MATHSSILAWRILRTEESGGLQSMGSQLGMTKCPSLFLSLFTGRRLVVDGQERLKTDWPQLMKPR